MFSMNVAVIKFKINYKILKQNKEDGRLFKLYAHCLFNAYFFVFIELIK